MEDYIVMLHVTVQLAKNQTFFYCFAAYFRIFALLLMRIIGICLENNGHTLLELGNRIIGKIKRIIYQGLVRTRVARVVRAPLLKKVGGLSPPATAASNW